MSGGYPGGPKNADTVSVLWEALRPFPNGATAKRIAEKLGWPQTKASGMLGRLAVYDVIDRVPVNVPQIGADVLGRKRPSTREYRYSLRRVANARCS